MPFHVPDNLDEFSVAGLQDLRNQAEKEYKTLIASVTPEAPKAEDLDRLEELQQFYRVEVPNVIGARKDLGDRLAALTAAQDTPVEPVVETTPEPTPEPEVVVASQGDEHTPPPRVSDLGGTKDVVPVRARPTYSTLVAAAGVPNYEAGQELTTMLDVAKAFEARSYGHNAMAKANRHGAPVMYPVAQLVRDYPAEFSVNGDETDYPKLLNVMDESRLPGGSLIESARLRYEEVKKANPGRDALVAAQGWCAPSETDYDICLQISTDGLYDAPEVQARRGGIRHNTGIEFDTIFGDCTTHPGYFDLTEAQVAAGSPTKTCVEIPCPDFTDDRLGVTGLCLTGNILAIRGYPEFTATFTRGALAALAHLVNREQIAEVVTGSVAVDLTAAAPWATDGSTVSQVLSAVELAIMDIKYRLRLQQNATLDVVMPYWIGAQMRADWIRRNGGNYAEMLTLSDETINAAFRARGARVQYVYDWQDAFADCVTGSSPGADTPISSLPSTLDFLVYPAGTWIRALNDVITLNSVYDSTLLATNQVTHLFTETGWKMMRMCPVSRVYTVPICPSGKTTSQGTLTCP